MSNEDERTKPDGRTAQGAPRTLEVPVGMERLLLRAADDEEFAALLLTDRQTALADGGVPLRPSEEATLRAIPDSGLAAMIRSIIPTNPRRRKFMGLVAAAATSVAAGTVFVGCDEADDPVVKGIVPNTDVDGSFVPNAGIDTSTNVDGGDVAADGPDASDADGEAEADAVDAEVDGNLDADD